MRGARARERLSGSAQAPGRAGGLADGPPCGQGGVSAQAGRSAAPLCCWLGESGGGPLVTPPAFTLLLVSPQSRVPARPGTTPAASRRASGVWCWEREPGGGRRGA